MQNIKLELPLDARVLSRAADFLSGCAHDLNINAAKQPLAPIPPLEEYLVKAAPSEPLSPTLEPVLDTGAEVEALDVGSVFGPDDDSPSDLDHDGREGIAATGDRDAAGFTWDERIHSTGKNDDGSYKKYGSGKDAGKWIRRRGVTPETVAQVEAELKGGAITSGFNAPTTATTPPPPPPPVVGASTNTPPPPPPPAATTATREVKNFPELMAVVQQVKARGVTFEQINACVQQVAGVPNVALMASHEAKIPALGAAIQAL